MTTVRTRSEAWTLLKCAVDAGDVEGTFDALVGWLEADLAAERKHAESKGQTIHGGIESALQSAIDGLRHAAMDYYVSTK